MVLNLPPYLRIVGGRQCGLEMLLVGSQRRQEDETDILGDGHTPCFVLGAFMCFLFVSTFQSQDDHLLF